MPNSVLNNTHIASISVFLQSSKATQVLSQDGYNSHCVFMLDQILVCPPDTMMMVGLTSGEIPYTFYNIGQTNNRLVLKTQLGTNPKSNDILIIVENQNYSVDSLVVYLIKNHRQTQTLSSPLLGRIGWVGVRRSYSWILLKLNP